jgi:hypothetical protein
MWCNFHEDLENVLGNAIRRHGRPDWYKTKTNRWSTNKSSLKPCFPTSLKPSHCLCSPLDSSKQIWRTSVEVSGWILLGMSLSADNAQMATGTLSQPPNTSINVFRMTTEYSCRARLSTVECTSRITDITKDCDD